MKVLVVEPLKECYAKEIGGLEEMQALVGGYIQAVYPFEDPVAVVCNDCLLYTSDAADEL